MYSVKNLKESIDFYKVMGMDLLRSEGDNKAFVGFGPEDDNTVVQLFYESPRKAYSIGGGYDQIAVSCADVYEASKQFEDAKIAVARAPGPVIGIGTKITAVKDPDGWKTVMVDAEDFEKEFE